MGQSRLVIRDRITAIIGAALLCVLVAGSYYYSIQTQYEGLKYVPSESSPDFQAKNVMLTSFDENGVASDRLSASEMNHYSDERMNATDVRYFSLNPEKPQLTLKSERAWSDDNLETLELAGNVTVTRRADQKGPEIYFNTEYMRTYLDISRLETDKPVLMRRGPDEFKAKGGMSYDNIGRQLELKDRVSTTFNPNTPSPSLPFN